MSTDFILDFETLGYSDSAVLLSVGVLAIPEDLSKSYSLYDLLKNSYYAKINREEQIKLKRTIDKETLDWWKRQGEQAKTVINNNNLIDCNDVYTQVLNFILNNGFTKEANIFSRGLIDQRWWQSFCKSLNKTDPLPFWQWRDTRTFLDCMIHNPNGNIKELPQNICKHNAVHDCCLDFYRIQDALGFPNDDEVPF